jgi:hypothetical protein
MNSNIRKHRTLCPRSVLGLSPFDRLDSNGLDFPLRYLPIHRHQTIIIARRSKPESKTRVGASHTLAPLQKICHLKDVVLVGLFVDLLYRQGHSRIASFN